MARKKTGSRLDLHEPLASEFTAFCNALDGDPPEIRVVRDAIRMFMAARLGAVAGLRERYEANLKRREGGPVGGNVVALPKK